MNFSILFKGKLSSELNSAFMKSSPYSLDLSFIFQWNGIQSDF